MATRENIIPSSNSRINGPVTSKRVTGSVVGVTTAAKIAAANQTIRRALFNCSVVTSPNLAMMKTIDFPSM